MEQNRQFHARPHDPFDDSAAQRHHRMGLLTDQGEIDQTALSAFCSLHAGLFFDDLLDNCSDASTAIAICHGLWALAEEQKDIRRALLALSIQYDTMGRTLPDPIWWIVGSKCLLPPFMEGFLQRLRTLSADLEEREGA